MTDTERDDILRLAKWRSIRSAPKDRNIDIWFSQVGIGYRPNCRWSTSHKAFVWHGSIPNDGEWCICSMANIRPSHWTEPLHLSVKADAA